MGPHPAKAHAWAQLKDPPDAGLGLGRPGVDAWLGSGGKGAEFNPDRVTCMF